MGNVSTIGFKWERNMLKFDEDFIKNYDEDSDKGYIFEVNVEYPKKLHDLYSGLQFFPERIKINICSKLLCNLYDKNNCCLYKIIKKSIKPWTNIKESS